MSFGGFGGIPRGAGAHKKKPPTVASAQGKPQGPGSKPTIHTAHGTPQGPGSRKGAAPTISAPAGRPHGPEALPVQAVQPKVVPRPEVKHVVLPYAGQNRPGGLPPPTVAHNAKPPRGFNQGGPLHYSAGETLRASQETRDMWEVRADLWKTGNIFVSAVLSIHNRSKLFRRALYSYLWQTMPPENWEILLLDDMSTEDLSKTYHDMIGRINMRHVKIDHRRHPLWKSKNPSWSEGQKENWYHTPAITMNVGFHLARGPVICLCHPEILHPPENFERAAVRIFAEEQVYLFGTTYVGTQASNEWLDRRRNWTAAGWGGFLQAVGAEGLNKLTGECYWYTSFIPRAAARKVHGVDFEYLNGVAGEDDDFRERVKLAGWTPIHAPELEGFHQDHSHEREQHRRRDTDEWASGLEANRALYNGRKQRGFPVVANGTADWTGIECFVEERRYTVGSRSAQVFTSPPSVAEPIS